MFTYSPLRRDILEIRLVRFLPPTPSSADNSSSQISLELRHATIDEFKFSALSYVWGDVTQLAGITVNGSLFEIGCNLFAALRQLYANGVQGWLWIDALCIQQSDQEEKSRQVEEMRAIFRQTDCVYSWLGPGTVSTDKAMDFVSLAGPRALILTKAYWPFPFDVPLEQLREALVDGELSLTKSFVSKYGEEAVDVVKFIFEIFFWPGLGSAPSPQEPNNDDLALGIAALMGREYWERIWINQEIALPDEVIVVCGTKRVSLDLFMAVFDAVDQCLRYHRQVNSDTMSFGHNLDRNTFINLPLEPRKLVRSGREVRLSDLISAHIVPNGRPLYTASDPRDLLFGLLGIIANKQGSQFSVDYRMSTAEVFTAMTRALIAEGDQGSRMFHLNDCIPREGTTPHNLPTWVPDWEERGRKGAGRTRVNSSRNFDACNGTPAPKHPHDGRDNSFGILRRVGCRVDTITEIMQPHEWSALNQEYTDWDTEHDKAGLSSIMTFANLTPTASPGEDYVWRTLLFCNWNDQVNASIAEGNATLIRHIMRLQVTDVSLLGPEEQEFLGGLPGLVWSSRNMMAKSDQLRENITQLQGQGYTEIYSGRLFKTMKSMLGLGHRTIKTGDIVTLLWGLDTPIILRPRNECGRGGFTYVGEAYVDQIMHGEFLKTNPSHEVFEIY